MGKKVYLSNYCHADHVWTNTRAWHIARYLRSINTALDVVKERPDFVYVMDNYCHFLQPFMENCPDRISELKTALQKGNFVFLNGGYSLPRPTRRAEEEFVRNTVKGKRVLEEIAGLPVRTFFNADTASGHTQLPQILKLSGHDNYICWRPEVLMNGKKIPKRFTWRGLNGDEISVCRVEYSSYFGDEYVGENYDFARAKEGFDKEIERRAHLMEGDKVLMFEGIDDCVPCMGALDTPSPLFDFIKEYNEKTDNEVRYASPDEFFRDSTQGAPLYEGITDQCDVAFNVPTKKPEHSLYKKRLEIVYALLRLERLSAICGRFADVRTCPQKIEKLWDIVFLISGHAEDGAIDVELDYLLHRANQGIYEIEEEALRLKAEFAKSVQGDDKDYILFNYGGVKRRAVVSVHLADADGIHDFTLQDETGKIIPHQIVRLYKNDKPYKSFTYSAVDVVAEVELPAMGYTKLRVQFTEKPLNSYTPLSFVYGGAYGERVETPIVVDNGLFKTTFGAKGIERIEDYQGNVFQGETGRIIFERTDTPRGWWDNPETLQTDKVEYSECRVLANGPLRFRFALLGKVREHHVRQIVTIDKGEPVMRMQTTVDCVDDCGRFWVKFGCDKEADVRVGIPFGEETRDLSVEKYVVEDPECMVEGMFFYGDYIKAKNGGRECCIVNGDLSTYAKLTDDGVCLFLRRMMGRNFNDDSEVGAWYNQCDRYIKATGVMEYEYGLCPFGTATAPAVTAKDFIVGTDFVKKYATAGVLPASGSLLALESDGVALSSLRDTKNGVELRVFEALGKGGALHIKHGFDTATAVDLNGNALVEPVDEIKPYQIKTILFK